jgi:hypothetical protein
MHSMRNYAQNEVVDIVVVPETHIWKVPGSNVNQETNCSDRLFMVFLSSSSNSIGSWLLPSRPSPIHLSSSHLNLYSLINDSVMYKQKMTTLSQFNPLPMLRTISL